LSSGILLTWPYHCSLFFFMISMMSGFPFTSIISIICSCRFPYYCINDCSRMADTQVCFTYLFTCFLQHIGRMSLTRTIWPRTGLQ
jgi:hypothetical protein